MMWLEVVAATVLSFPGLVVSAEPESGQVAHGRLLIIRTEDTTVVRYEPVWVGKPGSFTLVLPVPDSVESLEVLPRDAFDGVDQLAVPRLRDTVELGDCDTSDDWKKKLAPPPSRVRARASRPQEYELERMGRGADVVARLVELRRKPRPELEARLRALGEAGSAFVLLHVDGKKLSGALMPIAVRWKGNVSVPLETSAPFTEFIINAIAPKEWTFDRPLVYPPELELTPRAGADPSVFVATLADSLLVKKEAGVALVEHVSGLSDTDAIAGLTDLLVPEMVQLSNRDALTPAQLEDAESFVRTDPTIRDRTRRNSGYSVMRVRLRVAPTDTSVGWRRLTRPLPDFALEPRVRWRAVSCATEVASLAGLIRGWPPTRLAEEAFPLVRQPGLLNEARTPSRLAPPKAVKLVVPKAAPPVDEAPSAEELGHANALARNFELGGPPEGPMPKVIVRRDASGQVVHIYRYSRGQLTMRNNQMLEFRRGTE